METAGVSVQTAEGQREWAALKILSAGLEGTLSDGGGCEDAGGGQLEGVVRADCQLVVALLPVVQPYYILATLVFLTWKKKSVAGV